MNYHFHEKYAMLCAMPPQEIAASGSATGVYGDMRSRDRFSFSVLLGAVAAGKSVKVELMSGDASDGTGAAVVGEITYTAPDSGVTSHVVTVCGRVTPDRGRYLAVKVTNEGAAAILAGALLVADCPEYPEDTGGTTLVV